MTKELLSPSISQGPFLTIKELSALFNVSVRTLEYDMAAGKLKPVWIRGTRRFDREAIQGYLSACRDNPPVRQKEPQSGLVSPQEAR